MPHAFWDTFLQPKLEKLLDKKLPPKKSYNRRLKLANSKSALIWALKMEGNGPMHDARI